MTTKLTLTIEKEVIEKAKIYAKGTQRSLSEMVQKYLESLGEEQRIKRNSEKLNMISGIVKTPSNYSDEDLENDKREYLEQKYL